jgi:hypothetical protein
MKYLLSYHLMKINAVSIVKTWIPSIYFEKLPTHVWYYLFQERWNDLWRKSVMEDYDLWVRWDNFHLTRLVFQQWVIVVHVGTKQVFTYTGVLWMYKVRTSLS